MPHDLSKEIFRAYDIRGIVGNQVTEKTAFLIGQAFAKNLIEAKQTKVCVARDARLSGELLEGALIQGLIQSGVDVIELGVIATPLLYFATWQLQAPNGVMVTASHNPGEYNGFKFVLDRKSLTEAEIKGLYKTICEGLPKEKMPNGTLVHQDIIEEYLTYVSKQIHLARPLKIVVDAGNGVAGHIAPRLYRSLGCKVIELYCELDGRFPHHHPDPSKVANLSALQHAVLEHQADVGLAFDGDADRLGVITNRAEIIWPDRQMMLYAKSVLQDLPGATILFDVKCTKHLAEVIHTYGGMPKMWKTGHSLIKLKLKEIQAALGGEMSGHIFFNDRWFGFDDAIYTGARLLEILSQTKETSSEVFAALPNSISTPEINIDVSEKEKFNLVKKLINQAKNIDAEKILLDGLRLEFKDGWALMRASNTSPVLVLRFEADNEGALARIQKQVKDLLLAVAPKLVVSF